MSTFKLSTLFQAQTQLTLLRNELLDDTGTSNSTFWSAARVAEEINSLASSANTSLLPSANITYDLGSPTNRWRDIYLSGNTINLGDGQIKADEGTGTIALIPPVTESNPHPKSMILNSQGRMQMLNTTSGVISSESIAEVANTTDNVFESITVTGHVNANTFVGDGSSITNVDAVTINDNSINSNDISNWNTAYGWGNHASAGYLTSVSWNDVSSKPSTFTPSAHTHTANQISSGGYNLYLTRSAAGALFHARAANLTFGGGPSTISDTIVHFLSDTRSSSSSSTIGYSYRNNAFYSGNLELGFHTSVRYSSLNRNCFHAIFEDPKYGRTQASGDPCFRIYGNGTTQNLVNSYGGVSDRRFKTDITPSFSQWDDIKSINVVNYKLIKDIEIYEELDEEPPKYLGVIAQQLEEAGMTGLVNEDENGIKAVKHSIIYMKAIKALQEAMQRIEELENIVFATE